MNHSNDTGIARSNEWVHDQSGPNKPLAASRRSGISEMLTAKEVGMVLHVSVKTLYAYVQRGLIPYVRIQSNVRFRREEILNWIEQQSYRPRQHEK
jgi:excisionase family DNA binding protein